MRAHKAARIAVALAATALLASGCSVIGSENDHASEGASTPGGPVDHEVTLVTHASFNMPPKLVKAFEKSSGFKLKISKLDDAGALTNQLVLTKEHPLGDVVFGIDNTFASRAIDEGVFASYAPTLPAGADAYELEGDDSDALTPIDTGNVCINYDTAWFTSHKIAPPATFDDLASPTYKGLLVAPGASTSSPGLAFLLATISEYGDEWPAYWERLVANDVKLVKGWEDAYMTDFTTSGGDRPIVVSYDSSPAFTVTKDGSSTTTAAALDTCFEQVEYAGVLAGDDTNRAGAQAVVDWLLSPEVQAALPDAMYVFPAATDTPLPAAWARFAKRPTATESVPPADITQNRTQWIEQWNEIVSR